MEQESAVLLEEEATVAPRSWSGRKVLGVVGVAGLLATAASMPRGWSAIRAKPSAAMQAQMAYGAYGAPPGPYGAQQGYGAQVGQGPIGAPIAAHPDNFIPFAEAQAMAQQAAAAAPAAVAAPVAVAAPAAAGAPPGPYGAQQGYGAGVGHGPNGAPIAAHPDGFVAHADAPAQNGNKPATLSIFYETKCPYSQQFIDQEVKPALSDPTCVFEHVHIKWEPYGNVQDAGGALVCQHGEGECFGNKLHICAKKAFHGNDEGLNRWITCHMENLVAGTPARDQAGYQNCPGADAAQLTACANAPDTFDLFRQVGVETLAVHAEHMPWAVLGLGQPNLQGRLVQGLCEAYGTGDLAAYPKPACCSG